MDSRAQALDKLAEVLERRLVSSKRGARFRFSAYAEWSSEEPLPKNDGKEDIAPSDVRQCRDAVKMLLGQGKARTESVQRSTLRHLVLLKALPSDTPLHDKRLIDAVAELRKRLGPKLARLCSSATSMPLSNANSNVSASNANSNVSVSNANSIASMSKTPRHDLGASISYEECLRRRVLELEKELEDAKQKLEKLLRDVPSV